MYTDAKDVFAQTLAEIRDAGLWKHERVIASPQAAHITAGGREVLNFCANNYLGLSSHPEVTAAARAALDDRGYGLSSVRFICGTQDRHKELEAAISTFLGTEDTILYGSCFDANGGLFETLLGEDDAIISDALNHASIIDGVRLCKAERHRYEHDDLDDLEAKLRATAGKRLRMIATDGVFSMDGDIARLDAICDLAERYAPWSWSTTATPPASSARPAAAPPSTAAAWIASTSTPRPWARPSAAPRAASPAASARSSTCCATARRPYLFSNTLAPPIVAGSLAALRLISGSTALRDKLERHTTRFRAGHDRGRSADPPRHHPIVPVMLGDARLANQMAADLLERGIYVIGFSFPVVPKGAARIRVQLSAGHSDDDVDRAIAAFTEVGKALGIAA
jgi:glycine C-acetyltransferase